TCLDKKTTQKALSSLIEKGLVQKTGEFKGKTKSTPVYKITLSIPKIGDAQNESIPNFPRSIPKNGYAKHTQNWYIEGSYTNNKKKEEISISKNLKTKPQELTPRDLQQIKYYSSNNYEIPESESHLKEIIEHARK